MKKLFLTLFIATLCIACSPDSKFIPRAFKKDNANDTNNSNNEFTANNNINSSDNESEFIPANSVNFSNNESKPASNNNTNASGDERDVVAVGIGTSEEEAKRQTYRNAIQSVIGTLVLSETMIANDELIRDKILTHSDGYITRVKQVGNTKQFPNGLFEVTMNVTVKSKQLERKLQAENINLANIDGAGLFSVQKQQNDNKLAQAQTQEERNKNAANIIYEKIKDLPVSVLLAKANTKDAQTKLANGMAELIIPIEISLNSQAYNSFVRDFNSTMSNLGFNANTVMIPVESVGTRDAFYNIKANSLKSLNICELINTSARTSRWKIYTIPEEILKIIANEKRNTIHLSVELLNSSNQVITNLNFNYDSLYYPAKNVELDKLVDYIENNKKLSLRSSRFHSGSGIGSHIISRYRYSSDKERFSISPAIISHSYAYLANSSIFVNMPFILSEEELKSFTSVKCYLTNVTAIHQF